MKKLFFAKMGIIVCLALGSISMPMYQMTVQAEEKMTTVEGTIQKGTTESMLYLSTKQGDMEIKIDSNADTSGCKLLLTGKKIYATVYRGSDSYMHANKITAAAPASTVSLDTSSKSTVSAKIKENSTDEILYVSTPQGDMEIKLDATTDFSQVSVLVVDKTYSIVCVRGNDAYMHAVSIADTNTAVTPSNAAAAGTINAAGPSVSGTVSKNTNEGILYLDTQYGEMQFKLDSNTNTLYGMVHVPGNALTVYYTHGSDGYLHATTVAGTRAASNAVLSGSTSTVTGTVDSKSTESVLYLSTQHGMMELKLDSVTTLSGCKALVTGKWVSVTCMRGNDAYMHAVTITG